MSDSRRRRVRLAAEREKRPSAGRASKPLLGRQALAPARRRAADPRPEVAAAGVEETRGVHGGGGHRVGALAVLGPRSVEPRATIRSFQRYIGQHHRAMQVGFQMAFADRGGAQPGAASGDVENDERSDGGAEKLGARRRRRFEAEIPNATASWEDSVVGDLRMQKMPPARGGVAVLPGDFGIMQRELRSPTTGKVDEVDGTVEEVDVGAILLSPVPGSSGAPPSPPNPALGASSFGKLYKVQVRFEMHFLWELEDRGRTDISGPFDPAVTAFTKSEIVEDLTPPATRPARPPRRKYWASDITEAHELFHAQDSGEALSRALARQATWLNLQSASSSSDAEALGVEAVKRTVDEVNVYMGGDDGPGEVRAYERDKPFYQARAKAVAEFRGARREKRQAERRERRQERKPERQARRGS